MVDDCVLEIGRHVKLLVRNNGLALVSQVEVPEHTTGCSRGVPRHLLLPFLSPQEVAKEWVSQLLLFLLLMLMRLVNLFIIVEYEGAIIDSVYDWPVLFHRTVKVL